MSLSEKLGHEFRDPALLKRALTHASADAVLSNERLEFLGDRVLGLIVAEKLHALYPNDTEAGLAEHVILANSEKAGGGRDKPAILSGVCEAVIAALYLDGGMDAARRFVERYWTFDDLENDMRDAKTRLQEWAQARGKDSAAPVYAIKEQSGPDHAPHFLVEARVAGFDAVTGEGGSKRAAEQDAATKLLGIVQPRETS